MRKICHSERGWRTISWAQRKIFCMRHLLHEGIDATWMAHTYRFNKILHSRSEWQGGIDPFQL